MFYIKPHNGYIVIDPANLKPLPEDGAWVLKSSYWVRRLLAADVIRASPLSHAAISLTEEEEEQLKLRYLPETSEESPYV